MTTGRAFLFNHVRTKMYHFHIVPISQKLIMLFWYVFKKQIQMKIKRVSITSARLTYICENQQCKNETIGNEFSIKAQFDFVFPSEINIC